VTEPQPIACSLTKEALADRLGWISALNQGFLRARKLEGATLTLTYDARALADVQTLIAKEQECCGFLRFSVENFESTIEMRIEAPEVDEMHAEPLFAPFLSGAPNAANDVR
jgi:hypothetical protein